MKNIYLVTALAFCTLQSISAQKQEACKPANLQCDHLVNPLGIDHANPRLSWMLNDTPDRLSTISQYRLTESKR